MQAINASSSFIILNPDSQHSTGHFSSGHRTSARHLSSFGADAKEDSRGKGLQVGDPVWKRTARDDIACRGGPYCKSGRA